MFLNLNAFVTVVLIFFPSFFSIIQSEPFKNPKTNGCEFGFSKNSNKRCDTKKFIKCENRCDFSANCEDMTDELNCGQCDFSEDMCGWKDMDKTSLAWVRIDQNMRIQCNHSENQNCVLSLLKDKSNANNMIKLNNKARIRSPKFQTTSESCNFEFAYLHNENDCLLSVRLVNENWKLWFRDKLNIINQNDRNWRLESVDIGNMTSGFQMEFLINCDEKLTNRKPDKSFIEIAIKNTSWSDCEPNTNKSIYINDFDCDFKSNLCHKWTDFELINDKFLHWKRSNNYLIFGKNFDYKSNEYFVYTEKQDNKNTSLIARLSSLKKKSNDIQISLSFDYLITNIVNSSLYVLIKELNGKEEKLEIWKSKLSKSSKWQNMCLNVTTNSSIYQIIFEAHFEAFGSGLVAIKNIKQLNDKFCTDDDTSDDISDETSPFTVQFNTEQIPITTFETNETEIPSIVTTNLSINADFNISDIREYNQIDSNFSGNYFNESIVWILRGIAFLVIVLIFFSIKWWQKRKQNEELVPLTDSYDMINNRSNISETDYEL